MATSEGTSCLSFPGHGGSLRQILSTLYTHPLPPLGRLTHRRRIYQQKVSILLVMVERFIDVDGAKLRGLRRHRMLSLRELGERSGVAFDNINKLENEKHRAQPRTLRKLAEVLGVEPNELMKED